MIYYFSSYYPINFFSYNASYEAEASFNNTI